MNKSDLITAIANQLDMSRSQAALVLNTILEKMAETLVRGKSIELRGFGSFVIKQYESYEGYNPKTREKVQVKPKKLPHFKVGKELRTRVNKE